MEKSINALLNSNLRVIIPDFGAFIIRQKEPRIIVFNEFLRYNDGLLIEYMVKTEGIELEMAQQQLSDYTGHAGKVLETGNVFTIEGLGTLQKDKSGKIVFTAENEIKPAETAQSIKEESVIQLIEKKSVAKPKVKPKTKHAPKAVSKAISKVKPKATAPTVVKAAEEVNVTAEVKVPIETPPQEAVTVPEADKDNAEQQVVMSRPTVNRTNQVLRWILIILVANVAILAWFIFRDNIRGLFKDNIEPAEISDAVLQNLSDSVRDAAADTSLIFRETPDTATIEESSPTQGDLRYYIVAGCFRDEANADELVKSLKSKGFNAEQFGKIGNLFAVCFASFDDKELAVKELKRIREEIYPEAWMTRF